uniref:cytochrome P450 2J2-like isoform X2 n=1 Tax=Myxine glutinosa TaxID=7769 RepID=UPI00358EC488
MKPTDSNPWPWETLSSWAWAPAAWRGLAAGVIVWLLLRFLRPPTKPPGYPPGPMVLPLVGNFGLTFSYNLPKAMQKMVNKYGLVCGCYLGSLPMVVVSGYHTVKEALLQNGHKLSDRPPFPLVDVLLSGTGIVNAPYGEAWKQQRRFALHTMRNFGLGRTILENFILQEAQHLMERFPKKGEPFDLHLSMHNAASNVICCLMFGHRFSYDDEMFKKMLRLIERNLKLEGNYVGMMCNIFPFIMKLPGPQQELFRNQKELDDFIKEEILQHKKSQQQGKPRDLIDAHLDKIDEGSMNTQEIFSEQNLIAVVNDLFVAGTETTSTTLRWAFLYMMAYPDVQEKCWKEINKVAGTDALLSMDLRSSMPYVEAVLHEVQRMSDIVPFGVGHYTTHDITINNYHIPKKAIVIFNLTSVLNDPGQWKSPGEFRPERFLDEEGRFQKPEAFLPFSAGPRVCLGEALAKMELFLFFTSILQKFQFVWPDPLSKPDLVPVYSFVQVPKPHNIVVHKRVGA